MRDRIAGFGLFESAFNFRQEIQSLNCVLHSGIFRKVLNESDDLFFDLSRFHNDVNRSTQGLGNASHKSTSIELAV